MSIENSGALNNANLYQQGAVGQVTAIPKINEDGSLTIIFMTVDAQGRLHRLNLSNLSVSK